MGWGRSSEPTIPSSDAKSRLKRLGAHALDEDGEARLVREAQAMAKLSHPNVVAIYDVEAGEGGVTIVMEYVAGPTMRQWLRVERSWIKVVAAFRQAGEGLAAAHRAGLGSPGLQAGQRLVRAGRPRQGNRLRPGQGGAIRRRRPRRVVPSRGAPVPGSVCVLGQLRGGRPAGRAHPRGRGHGHAAVHGTGAAQGAAAQCVCRPIRLLCLAVDRAVQAVPVRAQTGRGSARRQVGWATTVAEGIARARPYRRGDRPWAHRRARGPLAIDGSAARGARL